DQAAAAEPAVPPEAENQTARGDDTGREKNNVFDGLFGSGDKLGWDGGLEMDIGYARYTSDNVNWVPETIYDFRGRFVLGPVLEHPFGDDYFFRATGQFVAWIREIGGSKYQINVDDVYGQVGQRNSWDLQVGRFQTFRVIHKGLGFDVYTLEDTGAKREGTKYDDGQFGAPNYELDWVYWRESWGKGAVHFYPTDFLGFEGAVAYGSNALDNSAGGRFAADVHFDFLTISAGAEHRYWRRTADQGAIVNNTFEDCDDCYKRDATGYGGSAVFKLKPVEIGFNYFKTRYDAYTPEGAVDIAGSNDRTTFGGYFEVDPGWLLFRRSLILGVGAFRTEVLPDNNDFERHDKAAAYVAYPLGFNRAQVKLVFSTAELLTEQDTGGGSYISFTNKLASVRTRLEYYF
ncbi:MAG TPA: hypothetical protein VM686_22835, partial [Polyangiaceae bacterium]|nr:hypothetical protein [Polyangiaceae bacterium]